MSRLLELLAWVEPSKAKIAVIVGISLGIVIASGKELARTGTPQQAGAIVGTAGGAAPNGRTQVADAPSLAAASAENGSTAGTGPEGADGNGVERLPGGRAEAGARGTGAARSGPGRGLLAAFLGGSASRDETKTDGGASSEGPASTAEKPEKATDPAQFLDATMEQYIRNELLRDSGLRKAILDTGEAIEFTIIPELQESVEKELKNWQPDEAAFVAIDPNTGAILALAGFEDGRLSPSRALKAEGPAASVFKIVTAAALVQEKNVRPNREVCFHGGQRGIPDALLKPDPKRDTTCQSVAEAMGKSSNVVFARLAYNKLSDNELRTYAERFGFNRAIPFLWPVELSRMDVPEDRNEFARMAAGFYHANMSPIHGAMLAAAVANGGILFQPQVVSSISSADGTGIFALKPRKMGRAVSSSTAGKLTRMMLETTSHGTAAKYFRKSTKAMSGVAVAGKTGSLSRGKGDSARNYSWFVGFAPADKPVIAVASLVVNGPKWKVKGPAIAKQALDTYFSQAQAHAAASRIASKF